ncbi:hypothetical protein GVY41_19235 [Frigidibacter albus]|uniref:Uncharacterized protein n=1 Tax=Frigidibacter albus TaxID=1465486 RepID=A0A6L8VN24_9RHOB|nr:hypothetical protein [Frigidibacter albus]MZQ91206.1 hypothetical protein [Frigidibacter albus]NBE33133.1 hypothetical protein [Frigidibacter albus]GGH63580.1 hypothetical protein GCM10011341_38810 [Frigidibacter albus]
MSFEKGDMQMQDADHVGTLIGALPAAPLAMPRQVLERPSTLWSRLIAVFGAGVRTRRLGN